MNHVEFDWDFENIAHIARHKVSPEEAEEAVSGITLHLGSAVVNDEWRSHDAGLTGVGRVLVVVTTERPPKLRVVTAYPASASLIRKFFTDVF